MHSSKTQVWDLFVRLFHWSLAIGILIAWLSSKDASTFHMNVGYICAALVLARCIWGFIGSRYARFTHFVRRPAAVLTYLNRILDKREDRYIGHNPAGGAMVLALISLVAMTAASGWMLNTDTFWGVLWVQQMHFIFAICICLLVVLHVSGVLLASSRHSENLIWAMITGKKRPAEPGDVA